MSLEHFALFWMLLWRLKRHWWRVLLSVLFLCTAFCFPVATKNYFGGLRKKEALLTQPANYSKLLNDSKHKLDILYSPMSQKVEGIMTEFRALFPNALLNSVSGLQSEHDLYKWFSRKYKMSDNTTKGFGVIFTNVDNSTLHYTIRSTDTDLWLTNKKFYHLMFPGPCNSEKMYFTEGFINVQIGINLGFMKYYNKPVNKWYIQEFPYPAYIENDQLEFVNFYIVTISLSIGMIPISIWLIFTVINEKNNGTNGLIKSKGGRSWMIAGSLFTFFYSQVIVAITISCAMLSTHFKNGPVFRYSIPLVVWCFFMSYGSVSLCFAYFCTALFYRTTYALLFFIICKSIPLSVFIIFKTKIIFLERLFIFIPEFALLEGNKLATIFEATGVGLRFGNIFKHIPGTELGPFVYVIVVMLFVSFVLCLLILYLSEIMPGKFEVPKPWHFLIPETIKDLLIKDKIDISLIVMDLPTNYHIEETTSFSVGIQLYNITKVYGVFKAVNSITMNIYKNQITALLGHNGAGKTTLMNILSGMMLPNSGFVVVDGVNVNIYKMEYRKKFSYCPQHNLVLHSLSVGEQIVFFGMLSGLSKDNAEVKGFQLMEKLDLVKQKRLLPRHLPEGVRRKLALANALISNPRILYLDEPTTGLDPKARRQIWDILLSFKGEKTIIISTHLMEEADVLGDRIAIMAHGELRCYGTTFFLKKLFSAGHTISIYYTKEKYHRPIIQHLKQHSDVTIIENRDFKQISFSIPLEMTSKLSGILRRIENSKQIKISRISISCTSLEDIFMRISKNEGHTANVERSDFDKMCHKETPIGKSAKCWQQYYALFYKKLCHLRSNWIIMMVMLYLIPGIYSLFCMTIVNIHFGNHFTVDPFILSIENYEQSNVLVRYDKNNYTEDMFLYVMKESTNVQVTTHDVVTELIKAATNDETKYRTTMIIAADFLENFTVFYSSFAIHAPAIAVNILFSMLTNSSVQAINYPYPFYLESCDPSSSQGLQLATIWICFGICLAICLSYFCIYTLVESKTGVKHLQYMMGITPLVYWSFQLLFDFIIFSFTIFLFVLAVYIYNGGIFQTFSFLIVLIIAFFLFGTCMILLCYASSIFFKNYSLAQIWVSGVVLLFAPGPLVMDWLTNYNYVAHYLFHFSPLTTFLEVIWQTMKFARFKTICSICLAESLSDICKEINKPPLLAFNIKTLIIWLIIDCILYFCILILLDSHCIRACITRMRRFKIESISSKDSDIMLERQKVEGKVPLQLNRKTSSPDQKDFTISSFEQIPKFDDKKSMKNTSFLKGGVNSGSVDANIKKQTSPEFLKGRTEKMGFANVQRSASPEMLIDNWPNIIPAVIINNIEKDSNVGLVSLQRMEPPEMLIDNQPKVNSSVIKNHTEKESKVGLENNLRLTPPEILKDSIELNVMTNNIEKDSKVSLVNVQRPTAPEVFIDTRLTINPTVITNNIENENNVGLVNVQRMTPSEILIDNQPKVNSSVIKNHTEKESNVDIVNIQRSTSPKMLNNNCPSINPTATNKRKSNLSLASVQRPTPPGILEDNCPSINSLAIANNKIESNMELIDVKKPTTLEYLTDKQISINPADELNKTIESNLCLVNYKKQEPPEVLEDKCPSLNPMDILNEIAKENILRIVNTMSSSLDALTDKKPRVNSTIISNNLTTEKLMNTPNKLLEDGIKMNYKRQSATTHYDNENHSNTTTAETNRGTSNSRGEQAQQSTRNGHSSSIREDLYKIMHIPLKLSPNPSKSSHYSHSSLEKPLVMVVDDLGKKFSANTTAVYDVSFTCLKGDCLGIVGPHGAGKSTLFMMITGLVMPTKGNVKLYLENKTISMSKNRRQFLSYLGYCPQIDSLSLDLTGREILKFFALLRGIPISDVEQVTNAWIENLDLELYSDKLCGQYSNGNKRKLCTALSFIGNPYVVLLDEPTSGIDTVTKKKLWVLFKYFQSIDETLVLNTHSMEECEVICNRITVMINGTLKCIGSMQHLKDKYTHGFTLYIKVRNDQTPKQILYLKSSIDSVFKENCELKYEGEGFLHYHVNSADLKCYELFEKMELIKSSCNFINEYTIRDTNLEQVFLDLAKEGEKE